MRFLRFFVALHWFIWASIIIPTHTRGQIQLPGAKVTQSCCVEHQKSDPKSPATPDKSNCAVCYFAAHIMPVVYLPVDLKPGDFIDTIVITPVQSPALAEPSLCHPSRAPPLTA